MRITWKERLNCVRHILEINPKLGPLFRNQSWDRVRSGTTQPRLSSLQPDTPRGFCVYSKQQLTRQRSHRKADLVVGVEKDTTMRDDSQLASIRAIRSEPNVLDRSHDKLMPTTIATPALEASRRRIPGEIDESLCPSLRASERTS